jgi:hypothetical protein
MIGPLVQFASLNMPHEEYGHARSLLGLVLSAALASLVFAGDKTDVDASNGVIHVIDTVILPPCVR